MLKSKSILFSSLMAALGNVAAITWRCGHDKPNQYCGDDFEGISCHGEEDDCSGELEERFDMRPPNGYQANSPTDAGKSTTNEDDGEETGVENSANRPVKRLLRDEEDEEEEERKTRFLDPQRACTRVTHTLKGHSRSISSIYFSPDGQSSRVQAQME
ncbi:hypothetical protein H4Q26_014335 [Puccinia striiformis f. sp. tritici PST-130]|nr:hypothetical protein H4Q26_014335 [Puccinia striiformis f. sp. tritici PST-130]